MSFGGLVRSQQEESFSPITSLNFPWTSPLLNIQFQMFDDGLGIFYPNGERFKEPGEFIEERDRVQQERDRVQQERDRAFEKLRELGVDPSRLG